MLAPVDSPAHDSRCDIQLYLCLIYGSAESLGVELEVRLIVIILNQKVALVMQILPDHFIGFIEHFN